MTMMPSPTIKQCMPNITKGQEETNRAYIDQVDKLIMEWETLGNKVKVLGMVGGLKKNSKLGKLITLNTRPRTLISNTKLEI